MSDYQACTLLAKTDTDLLIRAKLVHPDAALPSPFDRPTLLRMILDGHFSRRLPPLAELDLFDDQLMNESAPGLIEAATVEDVSGLLGPDLAATYRITVTKKARPALAKFKAKSSWGAAAMVPRISSEPAEMSFSQLMKAKPKLKADATSPEGAVKERVERLRRLLLSAPHARDSAHEVPLRASHVISMLGEYGADAWDTSEDLCGFIASQPNAIVALGKIGNPSAIGPIALAFGALVPNVLAMLQDPDEPHPLFHFAQYALTTFGWYGPRARPFVETMLKTFTPLPRQRVPLAFARWRVLGDESQRAAMLKSCQESSERVLQLREAIFDGPVRELRAVMDAVRDDLARMFKGERQFEWGEKSARKRLGASAPKAKPSPTVTPSKRPASAPKAKPSPTVTPSKRPASAPKAKPSPTVTPSKRPASAPKAKPSPSAKVRTAPKAPKAKTHTAPTGKPKRRVT
jgi:hypothetical protein